MTAPTHFRIDPNLINHVYPCRADGSREYAPMRMSAAPPVYTGAWLPEDFARYEQAVRENHRAYDAWHEVWGPRTFWQTNADGVLQKYVDVT